MSALLHVENLQVRYGAIEAVRGISFTLEPGQIVTLLGANGAGKSTTLLALSGLLTISAGSIQFDGKRVARPGAPPDRRAWAGPSRRRARDSRHA